MIGDWESGSNHIPRSRLIGIGWREYKQPGSYPKLLPPASFVMGNWTAGTPTAVRTSRALLAQYQEWLLRGLHCKSEQLDLADL